MTNLIEKEMSYRVVGILFKVHRELGKFCREKQYGDLFEKLLREEKINFVREHHIPIADRKSNFVDFFIENKILVDLKAKPFVTKDDYYQMRRYLEIIGKELGLIVNFRAEYLNPKRILNTKLYSS